MNDRLTVPNVLTVFRVALAIAAAVLAVRGVALEVAVGVCIAAALLDAFDGWYARTFSQCSELGKHLDPFADKLLMGVVYTWVAFHVGSPLVWALVGLVGAREMGMTAFRSYSLRRHGRFIPANRLGRAKMLGQSVAGLSILSSVYFLDREVPEPVVATGLVAILLVSYVSAFSYAQAWLREARDAREACARVSPHEERRVAAGG